MKPARKKLPEELRMSSAEFDRIMGRALQVKPEAKQKQPRKPSRKKRAAK